jgi:hypothetical protein
MNFESLTRFIAFRLSARLGAQVQELAPKLAKDDPKKHEAAQISSFVNTRQLRGQIRIPDTVGDLQILADLGSSKITCQFQVGAPKEGKNLTKINWLLRQLPSDVSGARIETWVKNGRSVAIAETLSAAHLDPRKLLPEADREIISFVVANVGRLGSKRSNGAGSFIESLVTIVDQTYESLMQPIKPWQQKAPKMSQSVLELIPEPDEFNER